MGSRAPQTSKPLLWAALVVVLAAVVVWAPTSAQSPRPATLSRAVPDAPTNQILLRVKPNARGTVRGDLNNSGLSTLPAVQQRRSMLSFRPVVPRPPNSPSTAP